MALVKERVVELASVFSGSRVSNRRGGQNHLNLRRLLQCGLYASMGRYDCEMGGRYPPREY